MSNPIVNIDLSTARRWSRAVRRGEAEAISPDVLARASRVPSIQGHFRIAIDASPTRDGDRWRWVYTGTPKIKSSAGFDGWTDDPRFADPVTMRNTHERDNDETGIISGYELDDGSNGTMITGIEPIEAGLIVNAWYERFIDGGEIVVEWWFSERNIPIVECPESEEEE